MDALKTFCGSDLWMDSLTWNTSAPEFTSCFQKTVVVWIPFAFLLLFGPFEIFTTLCFKKAAPLPWNIVSIFKVVISIGLILICGIQLGYEVSRGHYEEVYLADYSAPAIKAVTYVIAAGMVITAKSKGIHTSGILFIFWFLLTVLELPMYVTKFRKLDSQEESNESEALFIIEAIYFPMVICQLILSCVADQRPKTSEKQCPQKNASFVSLVLFWWFNGLAMKGWKKDLVLENLWDLNSEDRSENISSSFDKYWNQHDSYLQQSEAYSNGEINTDSLKESNKPKQKFNVVYALARSMGPYFLIGAFSKLFIDLLNFVSPQVLKLLINFIGSDDRLWKGILYAFVMFFAGTLQSLLMGFYFHRMFIMGMRTRTALISAIYRKSLVLSPDARRKATLGEIVNLMSVDSQRFMDLMTYLNLIWSAPLQIILCLVFLWQSLGPAVLSGLGIMLIIIPINAVIASKSKKIQVKQMKNKDMRVKLMNEILSGIKVLKLYAWEIPFQKQVEKIRKKEVVELKNMAYLSSIGVFIWICSTFLVSLVSFATYVLVDESNVLDASTAFVSISLFNILRFPLTMLPNLISTMIMVNVSVKRINKFLNSEELTPYVNRDPSHENPIVVDNASFTWSQDSPPNLKDISLSIREGSLIAIVGQVGSGKSSLLSAVMGEMEKLSGKVALRGEIAYVSQQAWIQNASLRDNVLFSKPLQTRRYREVLDACALTPDLSILPGRDLTEIGEKGINISGGQKQRVSLARAVYSDADVYLLDDPLSAVDSHVGKHIFENVIGPDGLLEGKTRLLVTHSVTYLPQVDVIVVLKDGAITEIGSYQDLMNQKGEFSNFLVQYLAEAEETENEKKATGSIQDNQLRESLSESSHGQLSRSYSNVEPESNPDQEDKLADHMFARSQSYVEGKEEGDLCSRVLRSTSILEEEAKGKKLTQVETSETGKVKWKVYVQYFKSVGLIWVGIIVLSNAAGQGFSMGSNIWLSEWSTDPTEDGKQIPYYTQRRLAVYGTLGAGQAIAILVGSFSLAIGTVKACKYLHNGLLGNILLSPMSFFDTTPLGRIVNRFSKDIDTVDINIPMTLRSWMMCFLQVLATLIVISIQTPIFLAVIVPIGFIYYFIQRVYVATSRQLKRLESVTRSPIYSHFSETLSGVTTIRSYSAQQRFYNHSKELVDLNQTCYFPSIVANRWLAIRLEFCGNCIILFSALFAVLGRDTIDPGVAGLSVSYALSVTATLNWLVRMNSELETNIVAVERILEYTISPTEAPWIIENKRPNNTWPMHGKVEFDTFSTRYREGLELVLKGISCFVKPGEKVGIVGRTGAGKSSLTLALFRIIEAVDGCIVIDGLDISKMGLHDLRSKLTIIPQDPVLFSGTLRMNLDPFERYNDDDVWKALEHSHLKGFVSSLEEGLQHEVAEGGDNLSVGQRQLVCLARALLRKTKILVLDEATAGIDLETDDLIQETIRKEFAECTVLTIAHRLNTVMDYDRIMVLDNGQIAEFEPPDQLLRQPSSIFYGMAKDASLV